MDRQGSCKHKYKCGRVQEENYECDTIVILDSGESGMFLSRFP